MKLKILHIVTILCAMSGIGLFPSCTGQDSDNEPSFPSTPVVQLDTIMVPIMVTITDCDVSRSFADGTTANQLLIHLYENGAYKATYQYDDYTLEKIIRLPVLATYEYDIYFWLQHKESGYTFDPASFTVHMNYDYENGEKNLDETKDAFYGHDKLRLFPGYEDLDILAAPLVRPFAQVNVGATDAANAKGLGYDFENNEISIELPSYQTFNIATGTVGGDLKNVRFTGKGFCSQKVAGVTTSINGETRHPDYIAMAYVLATDAQASVTIKFKGREEREFSSVPIRRNYRTNITGKFFTDFTDVTVSIAPAFDGEPTNKNIADNG